MSKGYKVKVNTEYGGVMYWTLSGSTLDINSAYIFTDNTMPDFYKQSLDQPYIEKLYIKN